MKYYDPKLPTKTSVDASKSGLGGVLLQKHVDTWAPVAYASRALNKSEKNYAQIEQEAPVILLSCERFHFYLYGKPFSVESDHKPLQSIFTKQICKAPPRIQRFPLKLQKYDMEIQFKPGKELPVADTLLQTFCSSSCRHSAPDTLFIPAKEGDTKNETEYQVNLVMPSLPISNSQLNRFRQETTKDQTLQSLKEVVTTRWPERNDTLANEIKPFFIV